MTVFQADFLRVIVALMAGWSLVMTVAILFAFTSRVGWGFGWRSIESRKRTHIMLVSASFMVLSIYTIVELIGRIGQTVTWRAPTLLTAFLLSGAGQYSMLSAQMADRRHTVGRVVPPVIPVDPVLGLIEKLVTTLDRIEDRQLSSADSMVRMEDANKVVANDLQAAHDRADASTGPHGAAADAASRTE